MVWPVTPVSWLLPQQQGQTPPTHGVEKKKTIIENDSMRQQHYQFIEYWIWLTPKGTCTKVTNVPMSCISFTYFIQYCSGRTFQYGRHCVFCIVCLGNTKKSFDRTKSTSVGTWFFEKSRNEVEEEKNNGKKISIKVRKNMWSRKKREEKESLNKIYLAWTDPACVLV